MFLTCMCEMPVCLFFLIRKFLYVRSIKEYWWALTYNSPPASCEVLLPSEEEGYNLEHAQASLGSVDSVVGE